MNGEKIKDDEKKLFTLQSDRTNLKQNMFIMNCLLNAVFLLLFFFNI